MKFLPLLQMLTVSSWDRSYDADVDVFRRLDLAFLEMQKPFTVSVPRRRWDGHHRRDLFGKRTYRAVDRFLPTSLPKMMEPKLAVN